jgi:hypothetical protein
MACFVAFEHLLFGVKYLFALSVPDVPEEVEIQLKRSDFITSKLIDNTPGRPYTLSKHPCAHIHWAWRCMCGVRNCV